MVASHQRAVAGSAAQDRRAGGGRRLWRPLDGARAGALGCRGDGAGARRIRRRCLDPQRRRRQRRHDPRQRLLGQGREERPRGMEEGHDPDAGRRRRFAGPGADRDRARGHRVPLAHERPLQRRFHAAPLCRAGRQGRHLQCERRSRHLYDPTRAAARRDCLRLLLWRHGGGAHRAASSRAVLRRPAEGRASGRRETLRPMRCREDRAQAGRLHGADQQRADRSARGS